MMSYVIRRRLTNDPPQISAWFRPEGWIIAPQAAAFFRQEEDAHNAAAQLRERAPVNCKGVLYEYTVEPLEDEKIDYSDIPEAGEDWFRKAKLRMPSPK